MNFLNIQYRTGPAKNFMLVGQSNADNVGSGDVTLFYSALGNMAGSVIKNGAKGGASISKDAEGTSGYHWDHVGDASGTAYDDLRTKVVNNYASLASLNIDIIFCAEQDAKQIDNATITKAYFKSALDEFLDQRQAESAGDYKAFIGLLGRRTDGLESGYQQANEAIRELILVKSCLYFGCETYDLNMKDAVHREDGALGLGKQMQRMARRVQGVLGVGPARGTVGPQILSATQDGAEIICTVSHDGGNDITVPSGAMVMFRVEDNGSLVTVNGIARTDAETITLTLASTPTGTVTLYTAYGAMSSYGQDDVAVVMDNATRPMPLRGGVITF